MEFFDTQLAELGQLWPHLPEGLRKEILCVSRVAAEGKAAHDDIGWWSTSYPLAWCRFPTINEVVAELAPATFAEANTVPQEQLCSPYDAAITYVTLLQPDGREILAKTPFECGPCVKCKTVPSCGLLWYGLEGVVCHDCHQAEVQAPLDAETHCERCGRPGGLQLNAAFRALCASCVGEDALEGLKMKLAESPAESDTNSDLDDEIANYLRGMAVRSPLAARGLPMAHAGVFPTPDVWALQKIGSRGQHDLRVSVRSVRR